MITEGLKYLAGFLAKLTTVVHAQALKWSYEREKINS